MILAAVAATFATVGAVITAALTVRDVCRYERRHALKPEWELPEERR